MTLMSMLECVSVFNELASYLYITVHKVELTYFKTLKYSPF